MLYIIIGKDRSNSLADRLSVRRAHLDRVQALLDAGRLIIGGPMPAIDSETPGEAGFLGSVIIAEFASLDAAKAWAEADPYTLTGVFETLEVHPYKQVLP